MDYKEAMKACIDGKIVIAHNNHHTYEVKYLAFTFKYKFKGVKSVYYNDFCFTDAYTYSIYKEPKEEEKKYRWLVTGSEYGTIYIINGYYTKTEIKELEYIQIIARLECLDDLKDKEYYTEEF